MLTPRKSSLLLFSLSLAALVGCASAPPPPPVTPAYQPNYAFKSAAQGGSLSVTLGVVRPTFGETEGKDFHAQYKDDEITKSMLSAMQATFQEVLIAKGFTVTGPFDSVDEMTFPDKKTADLLIYPIFDFAVSLRPVGAHQEQVQHSPLDLLGGNKNQGAAPWDCDIDVAVDGNISFVAQEPLSAQRMWVKRLDVESSKETIPGQHGSLCTMDQIDTDSDNPQPHHHMHETSVWSQDMKNAWARAHETIFQQSMKAFDNYVNGEEFQLLKHQAQELRNKKVY